MKVLQILLLTAMVAIAMEKCVAEYLLVEIEDGPKPMPKPKPEMEPKPIPKQEIAEGGGSMFNSRTTNECSWSKWSECSESCGNGFEERVCTNTAGQSGKGLHKETRRCQIRNNNCELKGYNFKSDYLCYCPLPCQRKTFSTLEAAISDCNMRSNCKCVSYHKDYYYSHTDSKPGRTSGWNAWIKQQ